MRKPCKICGREFEAAGNVKCCSRVCSNENTRRLNDKGRPPDKWARHRAWREAQVRAAPERFACALDPRWL